MMSLRNLTWTLIASFVVFITAIEVRDRFYKIETHQVIKPDYKQIRARHIDSDITTSVAVYVDDNFQSGDTILTRYNTVEKCLEVVYSNPESGIKVIVK